MHNHNKTQVTCYRTWTRKDARTSALTKAMSLLDAMHTKFLTWSSLNMAQLSVLAFGPAWCFERWSSWIHRSRQCSYFSMARTTTMGHCQAISTSQSVALENHQYDRPMDLPPKSEILSEIHYRVPFRSSAMTKTKDCFQTQTRQLVFSAGKQCEWSELHARSEPLRATIPVQNGARLSWDPWIGRERLLKRFCVIL